ncbi:hypothetical protein HZS_1855, partial [Henneguya salminicola]
MLTESEEERIKIMYARYFFYLLSERKWLRDSYLRRQANKTPQSQIQNVSPPIVQRRPKYSLVGDPCICEPNFLVKLKENRKRFHKETQESDILKEFPKNDRESPESKKINLPPSTVIYVLVNDKSKTYETLSRYIPKVDTQPPKPESIKTSKTTLISSNEWLKESKEQNTIKIPSILKPESLPQKTEKKFSILDYKPMDVLSLINIDEAMPVQREDRFKKTPKEELEQKHDSELQESAIQLNNIIFEKISKNASDSYELGDYTAPEADLAIKPETSESSEHIICTSYPILKEEQPKEDKISTEVFSVSEMPAFKLYESSNVVETFTAEPSIFAPISIEPSSDIEENQIEEIVEEESTRPIIEMDLDSVEVEENQQSLAPSNTIPDHNIFPAISTSQFSFPAMSFSSKPHFTPFEFKLSEPTPTSLNATTSSSMGLFSVQSSVQQAFPSNLNSGFGQFSAPITSVTQPVSAFSSLFPSSSTTFPTFSSGGLSSIKELPAFDFKFGVSQPTTTTPVNIFTSLSVPISSNNGFSIFPTVPTTNEIKIPNSFPPVTLFPSSASPFSNISNSGSKFPTLDFTPSKSTSNATGFSLSSSSLFGGAFQQKSPINTISTCFNNNTPATEAKTSPFPFQHQSSPFGQPTSSAPVTSMFQSFSNPPSTAQQNIFLNFPNTTTPLTSTTSSYASTGNLFGGNVQFGQPSPFSTSMASGFNFSSAITNPPPTNQSAFAVSTETSNPSNTGMFDFSSAQNPAPPRR